MAEERSKVLVVDDERFFRDAIRDALEAQSIDCLAAERPEAALQLARRPEVGVIVVDVGLPDGGGVELLRQLDAERPELRAIAVASQGDEARVLEALRLGACDYLAKPLHDEELVLAVRRALSGYEVQTSWESLRSRLVTLEGRLAELADARGESRGRLAKRAAQAVADVLGAGKTSLMLLDEDERQLHVVGVSGRDLPPAALDASELGRGVAGIALERGESLLVSDIRTDERFRENLVEGRYASPSFAVSPLYGAGRFLGVLCASDRVAKGPFRQEDLSLLRVLALSVGPLFAEAGEGRRSVSPEAVQAQLPGSELGADAGREEALEIDHAELARVICDVLTTEIEPGRLIDGVLGAVARELSAAPVSLYLLAPEGDELLREGQCPQAQSSDRPRLPANAGLTGSVVQTGRLVATGSPERDPRFRAEVDTPEGGAPSPLLCVPVRLRGKTLGVLRVFAAGAGVSARTGEILAAAISAAVRNVLMYRSLLESVDEVARARRETGPHAQATAR